MTDQPPNPLTLEKLIVLSGPSGVGKGTLCQALLASQTNIELCISATTRDMRPGEVDGVYYHFLSPEAFQEKIDADGFLEWAEFAGARYGTLRSEIARVMQHQKLAMVEIDVQGAKQIRDNCPGALLIFIRPPSQDELRRRLMHRGVNTEADIQRRINIAERELVEAASFDVIIENDDLQKAAEAIQIAIQNYMLASQP